jgi:hypothetical protein
LGSEQVITSKVKVWTSENGGGEMRIEKVEDRWDGKIPEGAFAKVGLSEVVNPLWWFRVWRVLAWWAFCWVAWTRVWVVSWEVSLLATPHLRSCLGGTAFLVL